MQISVSGQGVDVGESFRGTVEQRVKEGIAKYTDRVTAVDVIAGREAHLFTVNIHGNTGTSQNVMIKSTGSSSDIYDAFEQALDKVVKQLRRYKRRLTDHHKHDAGQQQLEAIKYVLSAGYTGEEEDTLETADSEQPVIIAEKPTQIKHLTVAQAVMHMDLAELPALMFYNTKNGRINVVYRRADGNISWVDPAEAKEKAA